MSAYALDFDAQPKPRCPIATSAKAEPASFADAEAMKTPRYVQAIFTCLSMRRAPLSIGPLLPQAALARVLDEIDRHPRKVSVCCNPATPEDIEIRDESGRDAPRLLLAIVFTGLSLDEARTALLALQSNPSPKGRK